MYGQDFFSVIREGCQRSAEVVVPLALDALNPKRVVDVGGGEGWWAKAFEDRGCEVLCVDGDYAEPVVPHIVADLEQPLPPVGKFDLAVSLEVAEHLSPGRAPSFVSDLCRLAPVILFSAAIPGQGGTGHRNEQWPAYWVDLFEAEDFRCSGALRWAIWDDERIENWYRQNLLVAAAPGFRPPDIFDTPLATVWPVVHPVLYDARRS